MHSKNNKEKEIRNDMEIVFGIVIVCMLIRCVVIDMKFKKIQTSLGKIEAFCDIERTE